MPSGVVMRGSDGTAAWYLVFGNGPTTIKGENSQIGKVAVLPMKLDAVSGVLENGFRIPGKLPSLATKYTGVIPVQDDSTDPTKRFISDMMTVDYDLEAKTDIIMGPCTSPMPFTSVLLTGRDLLRMCLNRGSQPGMVVVGYIVW